MTYVLKIECVDCGTTLDEGSFDCLGELIDYAECSDIRHSKDTHWLHVCSVCMVNRRVSNTLVRTESHGWRRYEEAQFLL
ncbi:MAG: hypothetical protein FWD27_00555 [Coriobacteriia bacterium]|nr:hypothetical protein [Coriobacteriia bacterium]